MTGLDKIIRKIAEESESICAGKIDAANALAAQITAEANASAQAQTDEIIAKANEKAEKITAVAKSSAESISRTKYLEVKNAVVNDIISAAYEEIEKMSDEDYFDLLYKLCVKNFETGECRMLLSARDLERLPDGFENRINSAVYENGAVQLSAQSADIANGFILDYGDFQVNCTLRAVFDEAMDRLKDKLCSCLFD